MGRANRKGLRRRDSPDASRRPQTRSDVTGLFAIALRLARKHGIEAVRVSHEASSLRAALTGGSESKSVMLKQEVQARGLKLLARDAREMAERSGIATADYFCGIAQTGVLTRKGVLQLLASRQTERRN